MAPATPTRSPGSLTVPVLFGWEHIVTALVLLIAIAVVFVVISAVGTNTSGRSEWQAFLDARSSSRHGPSTDPSEGTPEPSLARGAGDPGAEEEHAHDIERGAWPSRVDGSTKPVR